MPRGSQQSAAETGSQMSPRLTHVSKEPAATLAATPRYDSTGENCPRSMRLGPFLGTTLIAETPLRSFDLREPRPDGLVLRPRSVPGKSDIRYGTENPA